jgi:hypothetical protein
MLRRLTVIAVTIFGLFTSLSLSLCFLLQSNVADDSILVGYDALSVGNEIPAFQGSGQNVVEECIL